MNNKLMPLYDKIMLRKRPVIETIHDEPKNVAQLVHSRHRSINNFLMNVLAVIAAYTFFDKKPSINNDNEIEAFDGQLTPSTERVGNMGGMESRQIVGSGGRVFGKKLWRQFFWALLFRTQVIDTHYNLNQMILII